MRWLGALVLWLGSFWRDVDRDNSDVQWQALLQECERLRRAIHDIEQSIAYATLFGITVPKGLIAELQEARELMWAYESKYERCLHASLA